MPTPTETRMYKKSKERSIFMKSKILVVLRYILKAVKAVIRIMSGRRFCRCEKSCPVDPETNEATENNNLTGN